MQKSKILHDGEPSIIVPFPSNGNRRFVEKLSCTCLARKSGVLDRFLGAHRAAHA